MGWRAPGWISSSLKVSQVHMKAVGAVWTDGCLARLVGSWEFSSETRGTNGLDYHNSRHGGGPTVLGNSGGFAGTLYFGRPAWCIVKLFALPPFVSAQGTLERYPASDWRAEVSAAELKLLAGSSWRCPRPKYSAELIVMRLHVSAAAHYNRRWCPPPCRQACPAAVKRC